MDATQVIEKILSDAQAEADKIKKQAAEKEKTERNKLNEQLHEYSEQTKVLAQKAGEEKKACILAAARMEIAKEYLAEKRRMLDDVFAQVQNRLRKLPDDEYRRMFIKLMIKAVETGDEEVVIDNNETRIDQAFIGHVNNQLGHKGNLRLSNERQNIGAGFILKRGRIKNNVSLGVLLAQARKELEIELSKLLFES